MLLASDKNTQTESLQHWLKVSEFSQRVNNAITRYKYLNREGMSDSEGFAELDAVLKQGEQIQPLIQPSDPNYLRFHYDYLYALDFRVRSRTVLDEFTKLNVPLEKLPAYVRHAIADSYLAERQPQQAELAFKTLLTEKLLRYDGIYGALLFLY